MATALWKPVLSAGGSALLHDTRHDERLPEPTGNT